MNAQLHKPASGMERGLALVELIVVLLILALLAGTAITATEGLVEETHYDATRTKLEHVEEAILGPYAPPTARDDTLLAGFVADVGRLPRLDGTVAGELLKELWLKPPSVDAFSMQTPPGDPDLRIPGGWRGPYVRLGFGPTRLFDSWGQPFALLKDDATSAVAGDLLGRIESLGADVADGGTGYAEDIGITFASTVDPVVLPRHLASLPIRLETAVDGGSTASCLVRVYAPVDGKVRAFDQHWFNDSDTSQTWLFANVPVGPRVVRAYNWTNAHGTVPAVDDLDPDPLSPRSAPITVRLVSGGVPEVVLRVGNPVTLPPEER